MNTTKQSTFRGVTTLLAVCCSCATLAACSPKNKNDWFQWGKTDPQPLPDSGDQPPASTQSHADDDASKHSPTHPDSGSQPTHTQIQTPQVDPEPIPLETDIETNLIEDSSVDEVVQLYRRLHVEMDLATRSQLIVELLNDRRERVRILGFELASRDLSSGATLSAAAATSITTLLGDPLPSIRLGSVRLITRLALPDAMTLLTDALTSEEDHGVAEALLRGVERWPSSEARDDVLRWYQLSGKVRVAAANAAWGITDLNLWNSETYKSQLRSVYRSLSNHDLTIADMRLMAVTGSATDIDRLIELAQDPNFPNRSHAANALTQTPMGVDTLVSLAQADPEFTPYASESIQRHRLNPDGIRRLAALTWHDEQVRIDELVRMCARLDHDQLADAIRLARTEDSINDELSIKLLNPLTLRPQDISPRSAPGVILLAELELQNQRPDRALEILSLLQSISVDPDSTRRITQTKATSHVLLKEFDQAAALNPNADSWMIAITMEHDPQAQLIIAREIIARSLPLSEDQQQQINSILSSFQAPTDADESSQTETP